MGNISPCYRCGKDFMSWAEKKEHLSKIPECPPKPTPPRHTPRPSGKYLQMVAIASMLGSGIK